MFKQQPRLFHLDFSDPDRWLRWSLGMLLLLLMAGCSGSKPFTGFSYDPEGATETSDKVTTPPQRRVVSYPQDSLQFITTFDGARLSDIRRDSIHTYDLFIEAENLPINNSPWYAFGVTGSDVESLRFTLHYRGADHRYIPKWSSDRDNWHPVDSTQWSADTTNGTLSLNLNLTSDTLWIAAQEVMTSADTYRWLQRVSTSAGGHIDTVGWSAQHRPIWQAYFPPTDPVASDSIPTLVMLGRQHPPELTGALGLEEMAEVFLSDQSNARWLRSHYAIVMIPLINPDGVDNGHWRHNANGVDLNRDWQAFNQPETRAVRDALLALEQRGHRLVYAIDYHSTDEHILYPILREYDVPPQDLTFRWADRIRQALPETSFAVEPFDLTAPISKNWIVRTFGCEAVTFELNDEEDRHRLSKISRTAAEEFMILLRKVSTEGESAAR
jgi:hypothetical protein